MHKPRFFTNFPYINVRVINYPNLKVREVYGILAVFILSLALRLYNLPSRELGIDEGFTLQALSLPFPEMFALLAGVGITPPVYYIFAKLPFAIWGALGVKLLSAALSAGAAVFTYLLARELFGRKTAFAAGILFSVMPLAVAYGQHMRTYALLMLLFTASLFFMHRFISTNSTRYLAVLTVINIMLLYTHYQGAFIVFLELLYFFWLRKSHKLNLKLPLTYFSATILAALPWGVFALGQTGSAGTELWLKFDLINIPYMLYKFSAAIDLSTLLQISPLLLLASPIVLAAFAYGIITRILMCGKFSAGKKGNIFFLWFAISPIIFSTLISLIIPVLHFRFLSYLLPLFAVGAGRVIEADKRLAYPLLAAILAFWLYLDILYYRFSSYEMWNDKIGL